MTTEEYTEYQFDQKYLDIDLSEKGIQQAREAQQKMKDI